MEWRGDNKGRVFTVRKGETERESERGRAHIYQTQSIDAQSLEQGALEEARGPHQRGGISGGRRSEEALFFVWFPGACTLFSVSLNPLSDVVLQCMSTLYLGLLLVYGWAPLTEVSRGFPIRWNMGYGTLSKSASFISIHLVTLATPPFEKCEVKENLSFGLSICGGYYKPN